MLNPYAYLWLAGFVALTVAVVLVKDEKIRPRIVDALLIVSTIFVGMHLYEAVNTGRLSKAATPGLDVDKAELSLNLGRALKSASHSFFSPKIIDRHKPAQLPINPPQTAEEQIEKLNREAQRILGGLVQDHKDAPILEAKYALVTHELGDPNSMSLERLSHIDKPNAPLLHKALSLIYSPKKPTPEQVAEAQKTFTDILPKGWYRDTALLELYKKAGKKNELDQLQAQIDQRGSLMVWRLVGVGCVAIVSFFIGLIVILVQLFFLPRKVTDDSQRTLIASPVPFGFRTIYGVFMAWMVTQMLLSSLLQGVVHIGELMKEGVIVAAVATASLYLLTNGPGLLYIYLIAVKPRGLKFLDTVKWRARVGKLGPGRMVLAGWLTWFAAIPLVVISYLIALKLMNSQGSSNPVIGLVMEAARSGDVPAILMFYITLGVLAPICEETLFRGFLYTSLRRYWGVFPCLIVTSVLFAGVHMDAGGFLPLCTLGFLFGFIVERTKSILPSMVAHGLWNSGTFTLVLLLFGS